MGLFVTLMVTNCIFAQIEEFNASTFSEHNAKPVVEDINAIKKKGMDVNPYPPRFFDNNGIDLNLYLVGQQLYYTRDSLGCFKPEGFDFIIDGDKRVITRSKDNIVAIERASAKKYFTVLDVLIYKEELSNLLSKLESCTYKGDVITYEEIGLFGSKKKRTYTYCQNDAWQILKMAKRIYILQDENEKNYYVPYYSSHGTFDPQLLSLDNKAISGRSVVTLLDFISVDCYNYLKKKYVGKEIVYFSRALSYDKIGKVENIILKDGDYNRKYIAAIIYFEADDQRIVEEINYYGKYRIYDKYKGKQIPDSIYALDGYCLRSEADSIKHIVEQRALIAEREQKAKNEQHRKEIIGKYGEMIGKNILDGKACVGMTKEACKEALGSPDQVTKSSSSSGNMEVWVYSYWFKISRGLSPIIAVTFVNDKVSSVDEYKDSTSFLGL